MVFSRKSYSVSSQPAVVPATQPQPVSPQAVEQHEEHHHVERFSFVYDKLSPSQREYILIRTAEKYRKDEDNTIVTIRDVVQDQRNVIPPLRGFLKSQFCEENLQFIQDVARYREIVDAEAEKIFNKYFSPKAKTPLNVTYHVREQILGRMSSPSSEMFKEAQDESLFLIETDSLPKFLKSPEFREWKANILHYKEEMKERSHELPPWMNFLIAIEETEDVSVLDQLLKEGASVHDMNEKHQSAIHVAATTTKSCEYLEFLISRKADPNTLDVNLWTPLHVSTNRGDIPACKILLKNGARVNLATKESILPLHYFVKNNYKDSDLTSCLEILEKLVVGVDVNHQNTKGETPLHYCCRSKSKLVNVEIVSALIRLGASVSMPNKRGQSPLHTSIMSRGILLIKIMKDKEKNLDKCLEYAQQTKDPEIIALFQ